VQPEFLSGPFWSTDQSEKHQASPQPFSRSILSAGENFSLHFSIVNGSVRLRILASQKNDRMYFFYQKVKTLPESGICEQSFLGPV